MNNEKYDIKKRLMFIKGEDYYFITYNIFIFLNELGCINEKKTFKDYKKLAYLIDFISDGSLTKSLYNFIELNDKLKDSDRQMLFKTYSNGSFRLNNLTRLVLALEKKGYIHLIRETGKDFISIWMDKKAVPIDQFNNEMFSNEIDNSLLIIKMFPRIASLRINTLLDKIFDQNGVKTWDV